MNLEINGIFANGVGCMVAGTFGKLRPFPVTVGSHAVRASGVVASEKFFTVE